MKLSITPTEHFFMAGDVMVRLWQGTSDAGGDVIALVAAVAFAGPGVAEEVAAGLVNIPPPTPEDAQRWAAEIFRRTGMADG